MAHDMIHQTYYTQCHPEASGQIQKWNSLLKAKLKVSIPSGLSVHFNSKAFI